MTSGGSKFFGEKAGWPAILFEVLNTALNTRIFTSKIHKLPPVVPVYSYH